MTSRWEMSRGHNIYRTLRTEALHEHKRSVSLKSLSTSLPCEIKIKAKVWHAIHRCLSALKLAADRVLKNPEYKLSSSSVNGHVINHCNLPRTKVTYLGARKEFSINMAVKILLLNILLEFTRNSPDTVAVQNFPNLISLISYLILDTCQ
jgi:hypothetical protein